MNFIALVGIALFFFCLALVFRRTLGMLNNPKAVIEGPPMPKDLAAAASRIEKWKAEGRISREEYERLIELCRQDAETSQPKRT